MKSSGHIFPHRAGHFFLSLLLMWFLFAIAGMFTLLREEYFFFIERVDRQFTVKVLLNDEVTDTDIESCKAEIEKFANVIDVSFISREQALEGLPESERWVRELSESDFNPLPNSFDLNIREALMNPEEFNRTISGVAALGKVDLVVYDKAGYERSAEIVGHYIGLFRAVWIVIILLFVSSLAVLESFSSRLTSMSRKLNDDDQSGEESKKNEFLARVCRNVLQSCLGCGLGYVSIEVIAAVLAKQGVMNVSVRLSDFVGLMILAIAARFLFLISFTSCKRGT